MGFEEWLARGEQNGWISQPFCLHHGEVPLSEAEAEEDDPCIYVVRLTVW